MTPVINAWTGATINMIEPEPGVDGRAFIAYKVTNPSAGVWHYEYAVYNRNLDRAIQMFSVPINSGAALTNIGFHAPQNPGGALNDGTLNDAGFSNTAWTPNQTASDITWNSETLAQNQNANAIRWSTMYNFRFDSDRPPQPTNATVGFFKTGSPVTVAIQAPGPEGGVTPTPSPTATGTPCSCTPTPNGNAGDTADRRPTPLGAPTRRQLQVERLKRLTFRLGCRSARATMSASVDSSLSGSGPRTGIDPRNWTVVEQVWCPRCDWLIRCWNCTGRVAFPTITNNNWRDTQEAADSGDGNRTDQ